MPQAYWDSSPACQTPRAALSALLFADSPVHFTACDDLCVIAKRKEREKETHVPAFVPVSQS